MTQNVSDTLNKAADLIEERGWTTGSEGMEPDGSGLCVQGAILAAMGAEMRSNHTEANLCPAGQAVRRHLDLEGGVMTTGSLWWWNDDDGRTATEVIEVLRATALIESARERETAEVTA